MMILTIGGNKEGLECFSKMSPIVPCSWVDLEFGGHKDFYLQILFHFYLIMVRFQFKVMLLLESNNQYYFNGLMSKGITCHLPEKEILTDQGSGEGKIKLFLLLFVCVLFTQLCPQAVCIVSNDPFSKSDQRKQQMTKWL